MKPTTSITPSLDRRATRGALFGLLTLAATVLAPIAATAADEQPVFRRVPPQYIAALGDPGASSGSGAQTWGLWRHDPGPRGVWLKHFDQLVAAGGVAPALWKFDSQDWWLDENGLIMEQPEFPLPPGRYIVTGGREAVAMLTIYPPDELGNSRWALNRDATIYDVTHLGCRSGRYRPAADSGSCSPANAPRDAFKVAPGAPMPPVAGCRKQDYSVLIVVAVETDS